MDLLNLNQTDYSDKEIEDILELTYPYQQEDITTQKSCMLVKMTNDNSVNEATKQHIHSFLNDISNRLINTLSQKILHARSVSSEPVHFNNLKNYVQEVDNHYIIKNEKREEEAYNLKSSDGLTLNDSGGAPPGIINPIKYTTIKRSLNIDSRFRPNYYTTSASDQKINLPYKFDNIINMRLASIEVPLTYYTISEKLGNNVFIVRWDVSGNASKPDTIKYNNEMVVKIPDGNYDTNINNRIGGSTIESAINAGLQNKNNKMNKGTKPMIDTSMNIIYTVDTTSGKSIFAIDSSNVSLTDISNNPSYYEFAIQCAVSPEGTNQTTLQLPFFLGWNLGFRVNLYKSGLPLKDSAGNYNTYPAAIVSESICYIKGPSYIFVAIDDYNNNVNNYYVSAYNDSINNRNIIARINLASIQQSNGVYQTGEDDGFSTQINRSRNYFGPVNIEKLRITLYDEYGRIVDLNNMDWSCALMFECLYTS